MESMILPWLLIESLEELASRDLQVDLWINGDSNRMSSFVEASCGAFDDAGLTTALESGFLAKTYSSAVVRAVEELARQVDLVPAEATPEEIISHPRMEKVRDAAKHLLALLEKEVRT